MNRFAFSSSLALVFCSWASAQVPLFVHQGSSSGEQVEFAVAGSGGQAWIGAPGGGTAGAGGVWVFGPDPATGAIVNRYASGPLPGGAAGDRYGAGLADADGSTILIGSPGASTSSLVTNGSVERIGSDPGSPFTFALPAGPGVAGPSSLAGPNTSRPSGIGATMAWSPDFDGDGRGEILAGNPGGNCHYACRRCPFTACTTLCSGVAYAFRSSSTVAFTQIATPANTCSGYRNLFGYGAGFEVLEDLS